VSEHNRQICAECLEEEYEAYRHARVHESMKRNDAWAEKFRIGKWGRWGCDFEAERLMFSADDRVQVMADIVVVGSVQSSKWEWGWGNPHLPTQSRERMAAVREFGEEKEWEKLTTLFLDSDEYLGWELSAISAHILNAEGVYRCADRSQPGNSIYVLAFNTRFVN
jgi:hypothetical protein